MAIPMVGLYCAMRLKNFMVAWILTCALTLLLPEFISHFLVLKFLSVYTTPDHFDSLTELVRTLFPIASGLIALSLLQFQLKNRSFVFNRS
ncbi:MAG: hypothetical protein ABJC04_04525 [Verrucomicrobiota bacterium]